jgi:hypothetical protein
MKSDKRPTIQIEDLLRLKRAERPPAEFWAQFDRELRAKQLSALVARRPWWQTLPRVFAGFSRYRLPLGAAAVLTVTFISVREYQARPSTQAEDAVAVRRAVPAAPPTVAGIAPETSARHEVVVQRSAPVEVNTAPITATVEAASVAVSVVPEPASANESAPIAVFASAASELAATPRAVGLRHMGATLTPTSTSEPILSRGLLTGVSTGFEARALPARPAVEPLQQITPPSERMRARMLTAMVSMTSSVDAPTRNGERAAERLSEERLYDQVHRFSARGAGVGMKF